MVLCRVPEKVSFDSPPSQIAEELRNNDGKIDKCDAMQIRDTYREFNEHGYFYLMSEEALAYESVAASGLLAHPDWFGSQRAYNIVLEGLSVPRQPDPMSQDFPFPMVVGGAPGTNRALRDPYLFPQSRPRPIFRVLSGGRTAPAGPRPVPGHWLITIAGLVITLGPPLWRALKRERAVKSPESFPMTFVDLARTTPFPLPPSPQQNPADEIEWLNPWNYEKGRPMLPFEIEMARLQRELWSHHTPITSPLATVAINGGLGLATVASPEVERTRGVPEEDGEVPLTKVTNPMDDMKEGEIYKYTVTTTSGGDFRNIDPEKGQHAQTVKRGQEIVIAGRTVRWGRHVFVDNNTYGFDVTDDSIGPGLMLSDEEAAELDKRGIRFANPGGMIEGLHILNSLYNPQGIQVERVGDVETVYH